MSPSLFRLKPHQAKGGENMQSTTERRQLILEFISDNRAVSFQNIMDEFSISKATAKRDVKILSCSYPIYTQQAGGGGVGAMDGRYLSHRYLHDDQEALLRSLPPAFATMMRSLSFLTPTTLPSFSVFLLRTSTICFVRRISRPSLSESGGSCAEKSSLNGSPRKKKKCEM